MTDNMELNKIYNEDCSVTINEHIDDNSVDIVLTSPPYNNSRVVHTEKAREQHTARYDGYEDNKTDTEYADWVVSIFDGFSRILKRGG